MSVVPESPFSPRARTPPGRSVAGEWRRLEGIFDHAAAQGLAAVLSVEEHADAVHLDFSRAQRIEDRGLAALAAALAMLSSGRDVYFHGLSRHHIRLLGYFGVDADRSAPAGTDSLQ